MSVVRRKTYGWSAPRLSDAYSTTELTEWMAEIAADPASANPDHAAGRSIQLYTAAARRKMDALGWAASYRMKEARESAA